MIRQTLVKLGSGVDNTTPDIVRWLSGIVVLVALGLTIYVVVCKDQEFDIQNFGIGIGAIFAAVGAALKLKETTEPTVTEK